MISLRAIISDANAKIVLSFSFRFSGEARNARRNKENPSSLGGLVSFLALLFQKVRIGGSSEEGGAREFFEHTRGNRDLYYYRRLVSRACERNDRRCALRNAPSTGRRVGLSARDGACSADTCSQPYLRALYRSTHPYNRDDARDGAPARIPKHSLECSPGSRFDRRFYSFVIFFFFPFLFDA